MNKKNKKKKINLKKFLKGFTLVELLAVIVILAIIMIIAIPAVLETMESAKRKAMLEFSEKVMNRIDQVYMEKISLGMSLSSNSDITIIVFDFKNDLQLNNTGEYFGGAYLLIDNIKGETYKGIELYSNDYFLNYETLPNAIEYHDKLFPIQEKLDSLSTPEENIYITKDDIKNFMVNRGKEIAAAYWVDTYCAYYSYTAIDAATGNQILCPAYHIEENWTHSGGYHCTKERDTGKYIYKTLKNNQSLKMETC